MPKTDFELFAGNPVEKIFWGRADIRAASAHLYFTKNTFLQQSLHRFKYKGRKDIGFYFGRCMGMALKNSGRFKGCDLIVPLPLFASREKQRGYNQAAVLAEGIADILNIPVAGHAVTRPRKTNTQTDKNRVERWQNIAGKFIVENPRPLKNRHILLVDDVITTGATLEACAQILLQVEGARLSIAALAHTVSG